MTMFPSVTHAPVAPSIPDRLPLSAASVSDTVESNSTDPIVLARLDMDLKKAIVTMTSAQIRGETVNPYHLSDAQIELCRQTLGESFDAMLAQNGNTWDLAGVKRLSTMVSEALKQSIEQPSFPAPPSPPIAFPSQPTVTPPDQYPVPGIHIRPYV